MSLEQPKKLPASKVKQYRLDQLQINNICPICGCPISVDDAVLDLDHKTGHIRRFVLHRGCNSLLGKLKNNYKRFGVSDDQLMAIAPSVWSYIKKEYSNNLIHHTHKFKPNRKQRQQKIKY